jgi:hypothetical protein
MLDLLLDQQVEPKLFESILHRKVSTYVVSPLPRRRSSIMSLDRLPLPLSSITGTTHPLNRSRLDYGG